MRKLPDGAFDLVITSPPYNLYEPGREAHFTGVPTSTWKKPQLKQAYTNYDDAMPAAEYIEWQRDCIKEMLRLVPDTGAVFYNNKWRIVNGFCAMRNQIVEGFPLRQVIIWDRCSSFNFNHSFFAPGYEVIYLFAKPDFRLVPRATSYRDVWRIIPEQNTEHPAPFPLALPKRIMACTYAKTVLDPFMGGGTTAVAATLMRLKWVGIEKEKEYIDMAMARINRTDVPTCAGFTPGGER